MLKSTHSQNTVSEFVKLYERGRLNLEPAFQRRSVWTKRDRQKLIVSVFDGIPLPSVYIHRRRNESTGFVEYDVIDGKQRLETLMLFMDEGPLAVVWDEWLTFKSTMDEREPEEIRYWQDLSPAYQREFGQTLIPVILVEGEFSEVAELFVSINSTGKKLSGQERRHAFFDYSGVLKEATKFAENQTSWMVSRGVFSRSQVERMLHIEFVLEVMLFAYFGQHMNKKTKLDGVIRRDELDLDEFRQAAKSAGRALSMIDVLIPNLKSTRFRRRADLYSLVTTLIRMKEQGFVVHAGHSNRNELASQLLDSFGLDVDLVSERSSRASSVPSGLEDAIAYLRTVKEGTDSATQRRRREAILTEILGNVFDTTDPQRNFTATQRRIVWNADRDKQCSECGRRVRSWEDMHVDHVEAWVKGGQTDLINAAVTHSWCNTSKGAK